MGAAVFLLLLLRLGMGVLLCLPPPAAMGEPGLSPRAGAAHLWKRRHHHPLRHAAGPAGPASGVPSGHSSRHGAGVHHRRGDGAAVPDALLGLFQPALQSSRVHLSHQLHRLGILLHFAGAPDPSAHLPSAGGRPLAFGGPAGPGADRPLCGGCGAVHPGRPGSQAGPCQAHRGE